MKRPLLLGPDHNEQHLNGKPLTNNFSAVLKPIQVNNQLPSSHADHLAIQMAKPIRGQSAEATIQKVNSKRRESKENTPDDFCVHKQLTRVLEQSGQLLTLATLPERLPENIRKLQASNHLSSVNLSTTLDMTALSGGRL